MRNSRPLSLLVLFISLGGAARAASGQGGTPPSDQQVQAAVVRTLQDHRLRRGKDPEVVARDGTVTLSGQVQSFWEKEEAIKLARAVEGVTTLVSDLTIARAESDTKIIDALGDRVRHYSRYSVFDDIGGSVKNGVVTLDGSLTSSTKVDDIAEMAARIQGVQSVKNNLQVYPASQSDDQLRSEIARRIFGDADLERYARQVNPPIHIIVAYGRVTLKGFVDSQLDRQRIESLTRDTFGIFKLDNQLKVNR